MFRQLRIEPFQLRKTTKLQTQKQMVSLRLRLFLVGLAIRTMASQNESQQSHFQSKKDLILIICTTQRNLHHVSAVFCTGLKVASTQSYRWAYRHTDGETVVLKRSDSDSNSHVTKGKLLWRLHTQNMSARTLVKGNQWRNKLPQPSGNIIVAMLEYTVIPLHVRC